MSPPCPGWGEGGGSSDWYIRKQEVVVVVVCLFVCLFVVKLSTVVIREFLLFMFQLACGFLSFLFPKLPDQPRAAYLRVHIFFGVLIFVLAIATCLMGMTEKLLFHIKA